MSGKVVHVLGPHEYDEYVGRPMPRYGLAGSMLCNPHKIGPDMPREKSLSLFEMSLRAAVDTDPTWRKRVLKCYGLTLACWCAPKDSILTTEDETVCHAQIILRLADELAGKEAE